MVVVVRVGINSIHSTYTGTVLVYDTTLVVGEILPYCTFLC